jgi:hypothetical protein
MNFEDVRPITSGLAGALVSVLVGRWMSRWLPQVVNGKTSASLAREYRLPIRAANLAFVFAIVTGIVLYRWAGFSRQDWRPLGLATGLALSAPLIVVSAVARLTGLSISEALTAYALVQRVPAPLLYSISTAGILLSILSVVKLVAP